MLQGQAFYDSQAQSGLDMLPGMVLGTSSSMQRLAREIRQIAAFPGATVLLQGESGTGKEVVAHTIHNLSRRAHYRFMALNCAAIPEALLETELFGAESGAYTDAKATREGYLLNADGGTLFLDEIGAMPLVSQAKLLRFLETRSFRRVGGTKEIHVDLRVISATNLDLRSAVLSQKFRDDLFYRLNVWPLYLPPLRERLEDLDALVAHFLSLYSEDRAQPLQIDPEALGLLHQYRWPGNIRELRSVIQRGQIMCDDLLIRPRDLPLEILEASKHPQQRLQEIEQTVSLPPEGLNLTAFLQGIENKLVCEALDRCHGNQVQAASLLQMSRDQLRYRQARLLSKKRV